MVSFIHGFVFIGGIFYLPLNFQAILGYKPISSGLLTLALVLALSFTSMGTGIVIRKTGTYLPPIWFGLLFMTIGLGLFTNLDERSTKVKILLFEIVAGLGMGPLFQAPLIALQAMTPPQDIASSVATFHLIRNIATSSSVVIGGRVDPQRAVAHDVFANAFKNLWTMYVVISALGLLLSFAIPKKSLPKLHKETETGLEAEEEKRKVRQKARNERGTEQA